MSSACRWVPVFSKMLKRWVLAVATEMPRRVAAAVQPSPFKISVAIFDFAAVRPKRRRILTSRRRQSISGSCTVTIATGVPTPIQGISASRALERSGVTVTRRGERGSSRGILISPPGSPSDGEVLAHEAISFCKRSGQPAAARRPLSRNIPLPSSSIAFAAAFARTTLPEASASKVPLSALVVPSQPHA